MVGGVITTTAKSGSSERVPRDATGDSLHHIYSARPVLKETAFKGYRQLIIKDNDNSISDFELLHVAQFLCDLMGFKMTDHYVFENGSQCRRHIHILVRCYKIYNLAATTEKFYKKKYINYVREKYIHYDSGYIDQLKPVIERYGISLSSLTFEVCLFTSNEHMFYVLEEYWQKEQLVPVRGVLDTKFIDSERDTMDEFIHNMKRAFLNV